jgi:hypothetical protein
LRGEKRIIKRKLKWQQIENDVYAREENIENEIEIIDEKRLFFMARNYFRKMFYLMKGKKFLMRVPNKYRINGFKIIFEFKFRIKISHDALNYFEKMELTRNLIIQQLKCLFSMKIVDDGMHGDG